MNDAELKAFQEMQTERMGLLDKLKRAILAYERLESSMEDMLSDKYIRTQASKYTDTTAGEIISCALADARELFGEKLKTYEAR